MTTAVLPIKRFGVAKSRLDDGLRDGTRRALAEAMATDVLVALRRTKLITEVLVVTGDTAAEALAAGYDAAAVIADDDSGHNEAAVRGIRAARERGAERVLLVPGDCPALDPAELDALLGRPLAASEVVIVPDRHGTGTNALLLSPPDAIRPAFGAGSCARHEQVAATAGVPCEVVIVPSLGLDVDTIEDLDALTEALRMAHGGAAHTRGMLGRISRR